MTVQLKKTILLIASHTLALAAGFGGGIYVLPILIAPEAPSGAQVASAAAGAQFKGQFRRDLKDSDLLHWGEGEVSVSRAAISLKGRVAPGPDYKLYLSPEFVETEADFLRLKPRMRRVGEVKTFENFIVPLAPDVAPEQFTSVIVWCERFGQFITAAKYR